ncbi:uncharacterized protein [Paramisgurnus dabryanus]|uniref:uncharacterized protein n=1 Tax=Paramisgurnus dabryanus TaxID=90735 RepID=UPI003CCF148D
MSTVITGYRNSSGVPRINYQQRQQQDSTRKRRNGIKGLLSMETSEAQYITHSRTSGTEKDAELFDDSQNELSTALLKTSSSPGTSPAICGSAVSALQSKVRAVSQRKFRGKDTDHLLQEVCTEHSVKKKQVPEELFPARTVIAEQKSSFTNDNVALPNYVIQEAWETCSLQCESQGVAGMSRGLCEGSSLDNIALGGTSELQGDKPPTKSLTSSPRHWAPPKGFWKVSRPETLLLNADSSLTLVAPKDAPPTNEVDLKQKRKLKAVNAMVHKELQRSDSLESAFHKGLQKKETVMTDQVGGLWKADSWETVCSRGEMNKRYLNQYQVKAIEIQTSMRPDGQYKPPLEPNIDLSSYKVGDRNSEIIPKEPVFNYRPLFASTEVTLSPRHEQAKRLLERARLKARSQNTKSENPTCPAQREDLGLIPVTVLPTMRSTVIVTAQEQAALQQQDIRGRNHERVVRSRRCGQSPTRVRFEDESEKEAERRYLERVRQRGPVVVDKSHSVLEPEESRASAINWVNVGIPLAILTKDGECVATMVPKEEIVRACGACGSILGPAQTSDSSSTHSGTDRGTAAARWVSPGHETVSDTIMKGITLTKGPSLDKSVGKEGVGGAGESMSAFGKLRRRSRKGESRIETGHGPYARSQDLWAQRRNSKTRSSVEDQTTRTKVINRPEQGVTFAVETSSEHETNVRDSPFQLPIKSALKSGSRSKQTGQRVVKLMPSVQYRLIHLDHKLDGGSHHENIQPDDHLSVTFSASSQVLPVTSGLTSSNRSSSLRYSSAMLTTDLQGLTIWDTAADTVTGHLASDGVYKDPRCISTPSVSSECHPALRATSKADDLRSELLRSEHRKFEMQCDDSLALSRRAGEREGRPKLSLRRFFSAMGLNSVGKLVKGSRSNSMEHLCSPTARYSSASPSPTHRGLVSLQRTPSLQSLHTQSPLAQLRKVSSVQSLQSPKRKFERSTILGELPLPMSLAPRELQKEERIKEALEDSQGPLGRLVHALPDGTLLIELIRPVNAPFGFVISRGKGRPDSGIYVERIGDSPTENIYTGLLGVGDEILEVNGETIAGMTLDQVTRLMTRESKAKIRIRPNS